MDESSIDDEREALNRRRQEITLLLRSLTARDSNLDQTSHDTHRSTLQDQIRELDRRLAEIDLDEGSLRRMEGGE
jgi:hypothetical protein